MTALQPGSSSASIRSRGGALTATFLIALLVIAFCGYAIRRTTTEFVRADRELALIVCVDATDRASWNADGGDTETFLANAMTRACMASHGYALVTDVGSCNLTALPNVTPVRKDCYWRPRTNFFDLLRDDLYAETHQQ